ncbi:MAG TPA: Ser-Thr-rich GPI-anchored membrane family protein [Cyclobacteriaceae bacterium]
MNFRVISIILLLFLNTIGVLTKAQWIEKNNGLYGGFISALLADGTNLFAGTLGGVFLSTNNGTSWTLTPNNNTAGLFLKPLDKTSYKKGTEVNVNWVGSNPSDKLNIELVRNNVVYKLLAENTDNDQSFTWEMPKKQKTGNGYAIRISNSSRPNEFTNSQEFNIKPRIPILVKVLPLIAAGSAVFILGGGSEGASGSDALPGPVKPN